MAVEAESSETASGHQRAPDPEAERPACPGRGPSQTPGPLTSHLQVGRFGINELCSPMEQFSFIRPKARSRKNNLNVISDAERTAF